MKTFYKNLLAFCLIVLPAFTSAQLPLDINTSVGNKIYAMPENSWAKLNSNRFDSVWTPLDQQPVNGWVSPKSILRAWSSMAWDSKRGNLIFFGGGHANYPGNEIYLWNSVSGEWERASLPTDVEQIDGKLYHAKGGFMTAPISSHTYDNNEYLPIADRFITFGGAAYNTGGPFIYLKPDGNWEQTGPYLWNPANADIAKVGGGVGSQVNAATYPDVQAGKMWENRHNIKNIKPSKLLINGSNWANRWWGEGTSAYSYENDLSDTVYISDIQELFKYTIVDINDPSKDIWLKVGAQGQTSSGQGAGAFDPNLNRYVRTYGRPTPTMDDKSTFAYWDLNRPGSGKVLFRPTDISGGFDFGNLENFGMDYDPKRKQFILWDGSSQVWAMTPPSVASASGWVIEKILDNALNVSTDSPTKSDSDFIFNGILGKWKYIPSYDVFLGVNRYEAGDIWVYKPTNWNPSIKDSYDQTPPEVSIIEPAAKLNITGTVTIQASATDDQSVKLVRFFVNNIEIGNDISAPYQFDWNTVEFENGEINLTAIAEDGAGNQSAPAVIRVTIDNPTPVNTPPTISLQNPIEGGRFSIKQPIPLEALATDKDGNVVQVEYFVNDSRVGIVTEAPYKLNWTPSTVGGYSIFASATDNSGETSVSNPVAISVIDNLPPTVKLTTPLNGDSFSLGNTISLSANAYDSDGTISSVDFFENGNVLGSATVAPYKFNWTPTQTGSFNLVAKAIDNDGVIVESASVAITVENSSTVDVVLQNDLAGYTGTEDTHLYSYWNAKNYGDSTTLYETRNSYSLLIRFAIFQSKGGPVPDDSTVISAKLQLYKYSNYNYEYTLNRVLVPWDENGASWNERERGTPWNTPGASGLGSDISATADARSQIDWNPGWLSFDVTTAIESMRLGSDNYGWRLYPITGNNNQKRFYSSENIDAIDLRPKLLITYKK